MSDDEKAVVLDWPEAMNQVGGDKEFLAEVLEDLTEEAKTAEEDILNAINAEDFEAIMKAAHRIKGSATYLGCAALRNSSFAIQQLGHDGGTSGCNKEALLESIKTEYTNFLAALSDLKAEIERWSREEGAN
jgi:HPt (histidine-containing phosphotransfer) domain-containing protein